MEALETPLEPSRRWQFLPRRVALVVGLAAALYWPVVLGLFVGAVTFTGCFFDCGDANPVGGALLLLVPALLVGAWAGVVAWAGGRADLWRRFAAIATGLAWLAVLVSLVGQP